MLALTKINFKAICVLGFISAGFLLIFYAFLINEITGGIYSIKKYQNQIYDLSKEGKDLEVSFAKTGFMGMVNQRARDLGFEKIISVKFIQILDEPLAKK